MEFILNLDNALLYFLNSTIQHELLDGILPLVRNKYLWVPVYVYIIAFTFFNYSARVAWIIILSIISVIAVSDFTSSHLIKKTVERPRPCYNKTVEHVESRVACRASYSFPSSHATNHFSLAMILILVFKIERTLGKSLLFLWAGTISIAQVYVGIHYPSDVLAGAFLGILLACLYFRVFIRAYLAQLNHSSQR